MGGWDGMRLDDAFPIRHVFPVGPRVGFRCWAHWARFFIAIYMYISGYNEFISIKLFYIGLGRREWMDGLG